MNTDSAKNDDVSSYQRITMNTSSVFLQPVDDEEIYGVKNTNAVDIDEICVIVLKYSADLLACL